MLVDVSIGHRMPNKLTISHKQACDALVELVTIVNSNNPVYNVHILIKAPDKDDDVNSVEYTLTLESKTHRCMEIDRKRSNFQSDPFLTQCRLYINEMALSLIQSSMEAGIKMD